MNKNTLSIGIIFLFIVSAISPIVISNNIKTSSDIVSESTGDGGLMDSAWPMYFHDARHTCQSQYNSSINHGTEKWRYKTGGETSPVIDEKGNIYFGVFTDGIYSLSSNGSFNWKTEIFGFCSASLAIDKNGVIYVPTTNSYPSYFYAFDLNGSEIWKYQHEGENAYSSPAIAEDGTIYFGDMSGWLYAINPNGTLKWKYKTDDYILSSPAIGSDGIIYCISTYNSDGVLYAFYPNGTLKWKKDDVNRYTDVSIDDNGSIYYVSWDNIYSINADGSLRWSTPVEHGITPAISNDGIIYIGFECSLPTVKNRTLKALNSENGDLLWCFEPGDKNYIYISPPAISADGILYFITTWRDEEGGDLISLNPDGTERWRELLSDSLVKSAPAIGEDGTVYVSSCNCLLAFSELDPDAPYAPTIIGKINGTIETEYEYTFESTSPLERYVYYYINWGDNSKKDWFGPFDSGEKVTVSHTWSKQGIYTIRARAKDTENLLGSWGELIVTMPRDKSISISPLFRFLERYPLLQTLLLKLGLQ